MKSSVPQKIVDMLMVIVSRFDDNQLKASKFIEISNTYLSQILKGDRSPSPHIVKKIEDAFLRSGNLRNGLQLIPPIGTARMVPLVSFASAGKATGFQDIAAQLDDYVETSSRDLNAFGLIVQGDSMEREFFAGDKIVLEPNREAQNGDPVVAKIKDTEDVLFKWFKRTGPEGKIVQLISENHEYKTVEKHQSEFVFIYPVKNVVRNAPKKKL